MGARDLLDQLARIGVTVTLDGDRLVARPASGLDIDMLAALRACKPEVLALLAEPAPADRPAVVTQRCTDCNHLAPAKTCTAPVAAGLLTEAQGYGIAWPQASHGAGCAAFSGKAPSKATARPYRRTLAQADAAHAETWDDAAIARFQARLQRLARLDFAAADAEDLAERLHLRDVEGDDRTLCVECSHYRPGRCGNHRGAGLQASDVGRDLAGMLQRCPGHQRGETT